MLEIVIGIVFTFLLLSLLATIINELLAAYFGFRGYFLEITLKDLLMPRDEKRGASETVQRSSADEVIFEEFQENILFQQLKQRKRFLRWSRFPAYLEDSMFSTIFINLLKKRAKIDAVDSEADVTALIEQLPDGHLQEVIKQIQTDPIETVAEFRSELERVYNIMMDHASGRYKQHLQIITIIVGLVIAGALNADTFHIYKNLSTNADARREVVEYAERYLNSVEESPRNTIALNDPAVQDLSNELIDIVTDDLERVKNPLGLGWAHDDIGYSPFWDSDWLDWLQRFAGWIITALAITLGAPFWFDILKKLMSIRNSAPLPDYNQPPTRIVIERERPLDMDGRGRQIGGVTNAERLPGVPPFNPMDPMDDF